MSLKSGDLRITCVGADFITCVWVFQVEFTISTIDRKQHQHKIQHISKWTYVFPDSCSFQLEHDTITVILLISTSRSLLLSESFKNVSTTTSCSLLAWFWIFVEIVGEVLKSESNQNNKKSYLCAMKLSMSPRSFEPVE